MAYIGSEPISPIQGGTGVANANTSTLTLAGALSTVGAFTAVFNFTGATNVTFPTSGTLATTSQIPSLPVSLANGGTSASLVASNGGIFYSSGAAGAILSGTATARQMLQSGASSAPAWSTSTWPATTTVNQLLYSSATSVIGEVSSGIDGVLISNHAAGVPSWLPNGTTGQVLTATTGAPPSWTSPAAGGVSSVTGTANQILASPTTGAVTLSLIGPYTPATYTAHTVLVGEGVSSIVGVGPGSAGQVLQSAGAAADPVYSTATYPSTTTVNQILYSSSTNVVGGITAVIDGVLISDHAAGVPSFLANGTAGFVLTANSGAPPSWQVIPSAALTWVDATSATQALLAFHGYVTDRGGGVTYTLPASGSLGDIIKIVGKLGLGVITPNANQQILIASTSGTVGVTGTATSNNVGDCIELICITAGASTVWRADSVVGTWTLA